MTGPVWSVAGITIRPVHDHDRRFGLAVRVQNKSGLLSPTLAQSLRDWLTWHLGDRDTPPPADPDQVRLAIDQQRAALRERSLDAPEPERAGWAWADHALDAIARAAGGVP